VLVIGSLENMQNAMLIAFTVEPKPARYYMATNSRPKSEVRFIVFGNTRFARRFYHPSNSFNYSTFIIEHEKQFATKKSFY